VAAGRAAGRSSADRHPVRRELLKARAKTRIDIFVDDLGGGLDMGIGVIDPESILHHASSQDALAFLYTPERRGAETPPARLRKMLDPRRQIA
jgi:hypothetical protein